MEPSLITKTKMTTSKYKVYFTKIGDEKMNQHSIELEREDWKRSHFMKDTNRAMLVDEALQKLNIKESEVNTFKIEVVENG